jgi:serine/threonine protein kinase
MISPPNSAPSKFKPKLIGRGISGAILKISDSKVVKKAFSPSDESAIALEKRIYEQLGPHPSITRFFYQNHHGICLELLQCSLKDRLLALSRDQKCIPQDCLFRWARQLIEGIAFLHSRRVMQVDIGSQNVLIDWNENVKLCDFAGSSINGSKPLNHPDIRLTSPTISIPSIPAELFALSSLLYEIETTHLPYYDKDESEVLKLFRAKQFPNTENLVLGNAIRNCWNSKYPVTWISREYEFTLLENG